MKKFIIIIITLLVLSNTYLLYNNYNLKKQVLSYEEKSNIRRKNAISMMLETEANSKTYVQSTDNKWPTDGYIFNEEMSKCEQGSKLKWDDNNQKVIMEGNVSDKCYVFFDKYNPIKINSYSITPNGNKITISISATSGTGTITKYFYSKDDGASYVESTSNTYIFTNLAKGTYKIKAYVLDSNNKISEYIYKNIEITSMSLSEYVMSQYTGTQGENGIYYHDTNLTNGAGDNSYRYAGANPNNYVCFGSDDTICPHENLYRIIGLIDGKVKLISADGATTDMLGTDEGYAKTYQEAWGSSSSYYKGNGDLTKIGSYRWNKVKDNTWSTSTTNTINLNKNFLIYLDSKNTKWKTMINNTTWYVGGMTYANGWETNAKTAYNYEVGANKDATTVIAKIGLMYVSEYYYAATPDYWTLPGYNSSGNDYRKATNDNWLYTGLKEWTISRRSVVSDLAFVVTDDGLLLGGVVDDSDGIAVRPSFSLSSSIKFTSGEGTAVNPIRLN